MVHKPIYKKFNNLRISEKEATLLTESEKLFPDLRRQNEVRSSQRHSYIPYREGLPAIEK